MSNGIIVFMGYMGSGKTKLGKMVSKKLKIPFFDLDEIISKKENLSINEIFRFKGDKYFRDIEKKTLHQILNSENEIVLSLGGGTPCYFDNIDKIISATKNNFYLNASSSVLAKRLFSEKNTRPLISRFESFEDLKIFISKHLFEREPFYSKANFKVESTNEYQKVVKQILNKISLNMQ